MNKKTVAYVLIGAGMLAALYYFYRKMKGNAAAAGLGAGMADNRGTWAAEDDALYKRFRGQFTEAELNWIDPLVKSAYETSGFGGGNCDDGTKIQGKLSKAGSFLCVIVGVAPNPDGKNPPLPWDPKPSLWPYAKIDKMYWDFNSLKVKYGGL